MPFATPKEVAAATGRVSRSDHLARACAGLVGLVDLDSDRAVLGDIGEELPLVFVGVWLPLEELRLDD